MNLSSDPRALNHGKNINMVGQSLNILTFVEFRGEEWHLKLSPGIVIPLFVAGFWIKLSTRVFFLYMLEFSFGYESIFRTTDFGGMIACCAFLL